MRVRVDRSSNSIERSQKMSTNKPAPSNKSASNKPASSPPPPANGKVASGEKPAKAAKVKKAKVRWVSPKDPSYWVRSLKDVTDKHGAPVDPWGNKMEARAAVAFGLTPEQRAERKAAKQAEAERLKNMSPEEKLAFTQSKREDRAKKREAKKQQERNALIEQIKREIAEGKL
jgi:type IV secretory pathway VirB10-like protein